MSELVSIAALNPRDQFFAGIPRLRRPYSHQDEVPWAKTDRSR